MSNLMFYTWGTWGQTYDWLIFHKDRDTTSRLMIQKHSWQCTLFCWKGMGAHWVSVSAAPAKMWLKLELQSVAMLAKLPLLVNWDKPACCQLEPASRHKPVPPLLLWAQHPPLHNRALLYTLKVLQLTDMGLDIKIETQFCLVSQTKWALLSLVPYPQMHFWNPSCLLLLFPWLPHLQWECLSH